MSYTFRHALIVISPALFFILNSCHNPSKDHAAQLKAAAAHSGPEETRIDEDLRKILDLAAQRNGNLNDSVRLQYMPLTDSLYQARNYEPVWSKNKKWLPLGDSLFAFIEKAKNYGLFPADYHFRSLSFVHRIFQADSLAQKNSVIWARSDILLTDAFFKLVKDLNQGRFAYDSVTLRSDSTLTDSVLTGSLSHALETGDLTGTLHRLEPANPGYDSLKAYLPGFLSKAVFGPYTYLNFPYKDSVSFFHDLVSRFREVGLLATGAPDPDTTAIRSLLRKFQRSQGIRANGALTDQLVDKLNNSDWEKFKRIAINLDRYKLLPDSLPSNYVWVNLPSFTLDVWRADSLVFSSRVIVGEPETRTPLLSGEISNFVTYPQWTVPYSIIFREMLPKIQVDTNYLEKQNLMVVDDEDSVLDPHKIDWKKLNRKHFPYTLKQKQGDDNSLGVIKFNFRNKYSVYLHDTNVRWMFGRPSRALSHGCVRVQEWRKLADFLLRDDSTRHQEDSLKAWIKRQEKHVISGFPKLPIFIRYFSCAGVKGRIKFYDDIYEEDRFLRDKYFAGKTME
jgi:murein L,D-transpeptidase YcbB/YkuD